MNNLCIWLCLIFLFSAFSVSSTTNILTNTVDGDNLFKLIGKSKTDPLVRDFLNKLGEKDKSLSSNSIWTYPNNGMRIGFYKGDIIDKIMLYDNSYSVNETKFVAYSSKLPKHLSWRDTKSSTIIRLGKPSKYNSNYMEYDNLPVEVVFYYHGSRPKSRLRGVLLRFKNCISGDCQNGEGIYVERDGSRYEGEWKDGKRHGKGQLIYKNGVTKKGFWEAGNYKGQDFFASNGLYDLLGKHKSSEEVKSASNRQKDGYQQIRLAYDHFQYIFNNNKLRFYFNDYGVLYKVAVNKSGFGEVSHPLTEKVTPYSDQNYVAYIMGSPYKKYQYRTGSTWLYKDKQFDLRIRFDKNKIMDGIDVTVNGEDVLISAEQGSCKTGDCQNGFGELISESGRYLGKFKNAKFDGQGTMYYASGGYYKGSFSAGMREGRGTYIWSDNSKYIGNWKNNQKNGVGSMHYQNKSRYEGQWYQDQRHGRGSMYYPNGEHYIGDWSYNSQTGKGTLYKNNGEQQKGIWVNGRLKAAF
ncbi:MORN repeat-containing protein [Bernardetia litoralis]|nr:hypothetical protein [Bernardetia litoralis]